MFNVKLFFSILFIGLVVVMMILIEIGDVIRFGKLDYLCSYCGLILNSYNSGEIECIGGFSWRGNVYIKSILIECVWMVIWKDLVLLLYYKRLLLRMNVNKVIVKVVRKFFNRIRYVFLN